MSRPVTQTARERFDKFVKKSRSCWTWTGGINSGGYGSFRIGRKILSAPRVAYELYNGEIPNRKGYHGNCVRHSCDNRACVNPKHLSLGTQFDNVQDRNLRGRSASGESNGRHKLTKEQVTNIRELFGEHTLSKIAKIYSVDTRTIRSIFNGENWKYA